MDEKNLPEIEIDIAEDDVNYDELLEKFETSTKSRPTKKTHKKLSFILSLCAVAIFVGIVIALATYAPANDEDIVEDALIVTKVDKNNLWQCEVETTEDGKIKKNGAGLLLNYVSNKIKTIKVENETCSFTLKSFTPEKTSKDDEAETPATEYTLVGYEDFELHQSNPGDLANECSSLSFSKILSVDASENLKDYGLDKPRATATVTYTDKKKAIIKIGATALDDKNTYISFGNSNAVYLVAKEAVDSILKDMKSLISLSVTAAVSDETYTNFDYVTLSGTAYEEDITLQYNTDTTSNTSTYILTQPQEVYADNEEAVAVSGQIRGVSATDVVCLKPTSKDIKKYGLADNYSNLYAKYPDNIIELIASKPDKEDNCYLMRKNGNVIYKIPKTTISWSVTNFDKISSDYVLNPNQQGLTRMTVSAKETTVFDIVTTTTPTTDENGNTTDSTTTSVATQGKMLTSGYFDNYFNNVTQVEKYDKKMVTPQGKPTLTITYDYMTGRQSDVVEFYKSGDSRYTATVNSQPVGYVYSTYITKIIKQTATIAKDKDVEPF